MIIISIDTYVQPKPWVQLGIAYGLPLIQNATNLVLFN
jgi:hypothetical protein